MGEGSEIAVGREDVVRLPGEGKVKIYARDLKRILASLPEEPTHNDRCPHPKVYVQPRPVIPWGSPMPNAVTTSTLHVTFDGSDFIIEG